MDWKLSPRQFCKNVFVGGTGVMSAETYTAAAGRDDRDEYLRICGVPSKFLLGSEQGNPNWVRPSHAYALMSALNSFLNDKSDVIDWKIDADAVTQSPSWRRAALIRKIVEPKKWVGTDAQLVDAIKKFVGSGYLSQKGNELVVTRDFLELLLNHAQEFFQFIFGRPPPETWSCTKGEWLGLNEIIFGLIFDDMGDSWRQVRSEINRTISSGRPEGKNTVDHVGEHPAQWVVVSIVAFQDNVNEWSVFERAKNLNFQNYVKDPVDVATAIQALHKSKVLLKDGDMLKLAPNFLPLMAKVLKSLETSMPKFRSRCRSWIAEVPM
jgi:hypothetical protein